MKHNTCSIALGSRSVLKLEAMEAACDRCGITKPFIEGYPISSGQNEQPFGYEEIYAGAFARAKGVRAQCPDDIAVGIENGIIPCFFPTDFFPTNVCGMDVAVVVVIDTEGKRYVDMSTGVFVFPDAIEMIRESGFQKTWGELFAAEDPDCDPKDPHSYVTNGKQARKELLADVLERIFRQMI